MSGLYISSCLTRFMNEVADGSQANYQLKGTVEIFPVVNTNALQSGTRFWSFDQLDMDFAFPGNVKGEIVERIAWALLEHTSDSSVGIIIRTAPSHFEEAPHIQCYQPNGAIKKMARSLGLEIAREIPDSSSLQLSLLYQWMENKNSSLILSAGKPGSLDRALCDSLVDGIINMMVKTGLLKNSGEKAAKGKVHFFGPEDERYIHSGSAGMFLPRVRAGTWLDQGQFIGEIRDIKTGLTQEEILAPASGFLVSLRDYPVIYGAEPVATLLTSKKNRFWPFG